MKVDMTKRWQAVMQPELLRHLKPFRYGLATMLATLGLEDISGVKLAVGTATMTMLAMIIANAGAGLLYAADGNQPQLRIQQVMTVFRWTSTTISYFSVALLLLFIVDLVTLNKLNKTIVYLYLISAISYSLAYFVKNMRRTTG